MKNAHSVLSPSSAARRVACPGSRALEAIMPEPEPSTAAREGDAAHWVAARKISLRRLWAAGEKTSADWVITQEMLDGAQLYADDIVSVASTCNSLFVEKKIDISYIHPRCFGTPDCWGYDEKQNRLYIWDYKYGHAPVEAFENWQLIEYAAGILDKLHFLDDPKSLNELQIIFRIVQPRDYQSQSKIKEWQVLASGLISYFNKLRKIEKLSLEDIAPCHPSPECNYCRARSICPTLAQTALTVLDISLENTQQELTHEQLGCELRILERAAVFLKARVTGLQEQAIAHIKKGKRVPFYRIEPSRGATRWKVPVNEVIEMGKLMGCDLTKPAEIITPKQAEKAGLPAKLVQLHSESLRGELKLIADKPQKIKNLFSI